MIARSVYSRRVKCRILCFFALENSFFLCTCYVLLGTTKVGYSLVFTFAVQTSRRSLDILFGAVDFSCGPGKRVPNIAKLDVM